MRIKSGFIFFPPAARYKKITTRHATDGINAHLTRASTSAHTWARTHARTDGRTDTIFWNTKLPEALNAIIFIQDETEGNKKKGELQHETVECNTAPDTRFCRLLNGKLSTHSAPIASFATIERAGFTNCFQEETEGSKKNERFDFFFIWIRPPA